MSGYTFGPPPPPPPSASPSWPSAGRGQQHSSPHHRHGQGRGGGGHNYRGRGAHHTGGRRDYHAHPKHGHQPPAQFEYVGQPYPSPPSVHYGASSDHVMGSAYPPSQQRWDPDPGHAMPHLATAHPHAPVPLSSSNYHPNYAPHSYQPPQYPPQQSYGPPQPYATPYQGQPPPNATEWMAPLHSQQAQYPEVGAARAFHDARPPNSLPNGPPARHLYGHEPAPTPVNASYSVPYHPDARSNQYHLPPTLPPTRQNGYYGQLPRRARAAGAHRDGARRKGAQQSLEKHRHPKTTPNDPPKKPELLSGGKKKKRKTNTLGLTPGMESESEDDEGEEKVLTDLIGQEAMQVRDIATFLAERKKHFPTKARVEARKNAEQAQSSEDKASSLEKQADRLRKQLRKVESSIKRKREQGDEGDEMRDSSSEPSSDDEPDVMSTKTYDVPPPVPSPAKKADVSKHCKYYSTGGTCGKKGKCRFVHDPEVREAAIKEREANNGRLTIRQRLILNDKEQEDLAVLQSIQYLREKGIMGAASAKVSPSLDGAEELPSTTSQGSSLPAAPDSLPPVPVKRETGTSRHNPPHSSKPDVDSISGQGLPHYHSWLGKPYGSKGGQTSKSDDLP